MEVVHPTRRVERKFDNLLLGRHPPLDIKMMVGRRCQQLLDNKLSGGLGVVRTEADLAHLRKHTQPRVTAAATPNG